MEKYSDWLASMDNFTVCSAERQTDWPRVRLDNGYISHDFTSNPIVPGSPARSSGRSACATPPPGRPHQLSFITLASAYTGCEKWQSRCFGSTRLGMLNKHLGRRLSKLSTVFVLMASCLSLPAAAAEQISYADGLKLITTTADSICKTVPIEGSKNSFSLNGEAKGELSELIKKLANVNLSAAGKYEHSDEKRAVLDEDLAKAIKDNADCGKDVLKMLTVIMFPPPATPQPVPNDRPVRGAFLNSHVSGNDCKSDGNEVPLTVTADPGWKLVPGTVSLEIDPSAPPVRASPSPLYGRADLSDRQSTAIFRATRPTGSCNAGGVTARLVATETWVGNGQ